MNKNDPRRNIAMCEKRPRGGLTTASETLQLASKMGVRAQYFWRQKLAPTYEREERNELLTDRGGIGRRSGTDTSKQLPKTISATVGVKTPTVRTQLRKMSRVEIQPSRSIVAVVRISPFANPRDKIRLTSRDKIRILDRVSCCEVLATHTVR